MNKTYKLSTKILFLCSCLLISTTCSFRQFDKEMESRFDDPFDKDLNLNRGEIRELMKPGKEKDKNTEGLKDGNDANPEFSALSEGDNTPPPFSPVVLAPDAPEVQGKKRVTMTVTENIELKDVLLEIARLAELELALDPNIKGGVILSVNNRPINEVLDMISEMADLRYTTDNGVLKVVKDTPYLVNYNVDFLNIIRSGKGTVNIQTQVLSSSGGSSSSGGGGSSGSSGSSGGGGSSGGSSGGGNSGGGSGGGNNGLNSGSSNSITTEYDGNLWGSIESNLKAILESKLANLSTNTDQTAGADAAKPAAGDASKTAGDSGGESLLNNVITAATGASSGTGGGGSTRSGGTAGTNTQSSASNNGRVSSSVYYTINKQAGIISIMANSLKHKSVKEYLEKVRASMSTQVLIEAKVVEVQLNEQFASGIDWTGFSVLNNLRFDGKYAPNLSNVSTGTPFAALGGAEGSGGGIVTDSLTLLPRHGNPSDKLGSILKMIQGFGVTRTLQNPRLSVMNNQQAVLSFATNKTYYTVTGTLQSSSTSTGSGGNTTTNVPVTIQSSLHTIPIGVILAMQPSIDLDAREVTLHVRPTLSVIQDAGQPDPAVALLAASISGLNSDQQAAVSSALNNNKVPVVQVREMDTMLKIKSGEVMVIGGLISHNDQNIESGLPYGSRVPFFGNLFRTQQSTNAATETIILIQATILTPEGYHHKHDKKMVESFTNDPKPWAF